MARLSGLEQIIQDSDLANGGRKLLASMFAHADVSQMADRKTRPSPEYVTGIDNAALTKDQLSASPHRRNR